MGRKKKSLTWSKIKLVQQNKQASLLNKMEKKAKRYERKLEKKEKCDESVALHGYSVSLSVMSIK